jgi:transglutaminase-like putative cysteine protease
VATKRSYPVVCIARAVLTFAATLGLARVYADASWIVPVAFAAFLPHALQEFAARRRWGGLLTLVVLLAAGWWLAMLVDDPGTTFLGMPTPSTFATFFQDLGHAPNELRSAVVPVAVGGPALLLAVIATYVVGALSEWTARRFDAPIGAIGPSVALFISIAALGQGRWAPTTACYGLAVLVYLLVLHYEELTERRSWFHTAGSKRSRLLTGGAAAAAFIVLVAIALGPAMPGADGEPLLDYRSLGEGGQGSVLTASPPILTLHDKLTQPAKKELFTVHTNDGKGWYWRVIALDHLSDDTWTVPPTDSESASKLDRPQNLPRSHRSVQQFDLGSLDAVWLPAAYRPTSITLHGAQVVPKSLTLYLASGALSDLRYTVESEIPQPTETELLRVRPRDLRDQADLTQLPDNFPDRVRNLAREVTKNAHTPYEEAVALEQFFGAQNGFTYTLDTNLHSSSRALEAFLFETKAGFCEQYAGAYAAMARSIGLPTRVAVGYQRGTQQQDGTWHVTNHDAHAWPEVWLGDEIGWYAFEPTPGRSNPSNNRGNGPSTPSTQPDSTPTTASNTGTSAPAQTNVPPSNPKGLEVPGQSTPTTKHDNTVQRVFLALLAIVGLAIAAAIIVLIGAAISAVLRTRRRRHHADARHRVLGAWAEALERMTAAGVEPRPSATPIEFALRYAPAHGAGAAGPPLMELARLQTSAMFAPDPPSDAEADDAWQHFDTIDRSVRHSVSRLERWKQRLRPPRPPSTDDDHDYQHEVRV